MPIVWVPSWTHSWNTKKVAAPPKPREETQRMRSRCGMQKTRRPRHYCGTCKDNTSKDPFSRCEICKNLVTDEIDDHRIQSDYNMNCNIQKERTLHLVLRMRGEDARHQ